LTGTQTKPARIAPNAAAMNSAEFAARIAMRSPRVSPSPGARVASGDQRGIDQRAEVVRVLHGETPAVR
jgi:hypothetical protein